MKVLDRHIIILNSAKATSELLEKRSTIYSDRPRVVFAGELYAVIYLSRSVNLSFNLPPFFCVRMGWNLSWGLIRYGDRFKAYRRLTHQQMGYQAVQQYQPIQEAAVHSYLLHLATSPETYREDLTRFDVP